MARCAFLVASAGGHLEELCQMRDVLVPKDTKVIWVTGDCPQSRSVLAAESDVVYLPQVGSRDYRGLIRTAVPAVRMLLRHRPRDVYSTGAALALAFLPIAWIVGARATYIESAARTSGPSFTGRILTAVPWLRLRTQYRGWANARWHYSGSVFDGYVGEQTERGTPAVRRLVVTLGTQEGFPFVTLVKRVSEIVPKGTEVLWQIGGGYPRGSRPDGARDVIPMSELCDWTQSADAVIAHAGVGSALTLLQQGVAPVLVPRSSDRGEHVDEHQRLIAEELEARGLAVVAEADSLTWADVVRSTSMRVRPLNSTSHLAAHGASGSGGHLGGAAL